MTEKRSRNEEAARLEREAETAKRRMIMNARASAERQNLMRRINTRGTMMLAMRRSRRVEDMYQRMVAKVMRQMTYTSTDFKQLGKIVRARLDRKWDDVERLINEWQEAVKRRACRLKKAQMKNLAAGLNINVTNKNTRQTICAKIKN